MILMGRRRGAVYTVAARFVRQQERGAQHFWRGPKRKRVRPSHVEKLDSYSIFDKLCLVAIGLCIKSPKTIFCSVGEAANKIIDN